MKWENALREWIRAHAMALGYAAVVLLGLFLRYSYMPLLSADFRFFNIPWLEAVREGGVKAVLNPELQYNYSALYLYLMALLAKLPGSPDTHMLLKGLCIVMEMLTSLTAFALIRRATASRSHHFVGFAAVWLSPVLLWNAAGWGQMDTGFALFSLLAVWLLIREKPVWALMALGVALSWKLQAILLMPLFLLYWFCGKKRFSLFAFLLVPAIWVLSGVPMMHFGESPLFAVKTYLGQAEQYPQATFNYPNLFAIMGEAANQKQMVVGMFSRMGIALAIAALGSMAVWMLYRRVQLHGAQSLLLAGAWCVLCCTFLLPRMHERYAIVGELLLLCWAASTGRKRGWICFLASMLTTLSAYAEYLFKHPFFSLQVGGVVNLAVLLYLTWKMITTLSKYAEPEQGGVVHD